MDAEAMHCVIDVEGKYTSLVQLCERIKTKLHPEVKKGARFPSCFSFDLGGDPDRFLSRVHSALEEMESKGHRFEVFVRNKKQAEPVEFETRGSITIGSLCISQVRDSQRPGPGEVRIEPQRAFGSGLHPTTRLCLSFLSGFGLNNARVLDVGCGTGILGLAALRRGARSVLGLELDPLAARTARKNAECNHLSQSFCIACSEVLCVRTAFDFVMANLPPATLFSMLGDLLAHTTKDGLLLLSGFGPNQRPDLEQKLAPLGGKIRSHREQDNWSAAVVDRTQGFPT